MTCWSYPFITKEKLLPNIDSVRIVGGKTHSTLWLVLTIRLTETGLA
jgi:hypothetical protein